MMQLGNVRQKFQGLGLHRIRQVQRLKQAWGGHRNSSQWPYGQLAQQLGQVAPWIFIEGHWALRLMLHGLFGAAWPLRHQALVAAGGVMKTPSASNPRPKPSAHRRCRY